MSTAKTEIGPWLKYHARRLTLDDTLQLPPAPQPPRHRIPVELAVDRVTMVQHLLVLSLPSDVSRYDDFQIWADEEWHDVGNPHTYIRPRTVALTQGGSGIVVPRWWDDEEVRVFRVEVHE